MHLADYPTRVEGKRMRRVPIILTGNDFTRLYAPLRRSGRMRIFCWRMKTAERAAAVNSLFPWLSGEQAADLVGRFPDEPISFWAAVRVFVVAGGGINSSASVEWMRAISSLDFGSFGAMAPDSMAASRRSSRRSALRAALSGPWQAKQFSARMGRMSRLYSSLGASAAVAGPAAHAPASPRPDRSGARCARRP